MSSSLGGAGLSKQILKHNHKESLPNPIEEIVRTATSKKDSQVIGLTIHFNIIVWLSKGSDKE